MEEKEFKEYLIDRLNKINQGWIDGDKTNNLNKTTDLVNTSLKIALEIKDDKIFKYIAPPLTGEMIKQGLDLSKKGEQFKDDARDANKKFKNYPDYKTILLLRTELVNIPLDVVGYLFSGLRRFIKPGKQLIEIGRKNKFLSFTNTKEIGCYLLYGNNKYYYIKNPNANPNRNFLKEDLERTLGETTENILI